MSMELIQPEEFTMIQRMGTAIATSGFFELAGGTGERAIAQAAVKVMAGRELGIPPVAAMMGIHVIKNRVSLSAQLMLACAKRAGYRWDKHEADGWCELDWYDAKDNLLGKSKFSIEEARAAGIVTPGSTWTKYPKNMLFWRAAAIGVREFCPDSISGMVIHTPDELGHDIDPEDSAAASPAFSKEGQAEVMRAQLVAAGMDEEKAAKEAEKFAAPKGKKAKPEPLGITDDDLPPELQTKREPTDAELDAQFAKQDAVKTTANMWK